MRFAEPQSYDHAPGGQHVSAAEEGKLNLSRSLSPIHRGARRGRKENFQLEKARIKYEALKFFLFLYAPCDLRSEKPFLEPF
jgi:hypothetical protein